MGFEVTIIISIISLVINIIAVIISLLVLIQVQKQSKILKEQNTMNNHLYKQNIKGK